MRRWVQADDGSSCHDLFRHEVFESRHFMGLVGDFVGNAGGDHDNAFPVTDDDVAGKDRNTAAADRKVEVDGLMQGQVCR